MNIPILTTLERKKQMEELHIDWTLNDIGEISRTLQFATFMEAIQCIQDVATIAEAADHHPDIQNSYTKTTFSLITHDAGGITMKDIHLAKEIDYIYEKKN